MAVYTVYADVLWLVNFVLDYVLLWAVARFGAFACHRWRLLVAAALGGLYGVGLVFGVLAPLYIMPLPLMFPVAMLLVGFGRMSLRRFGWLVLCFYLLAAVMGGAALAVRFLLAGSLGAVSAMWLAPALLVAVVLALISVGQWRRAVRQCGLVVPARLKFADRTCEISCFLDSGNTLQEPVSGRPVLLCEVGALVGLLPGDFYMELARGLMRQANGGDFRPYQLLMAMQGRDIAHGLTLVPYAGVEGGGMLGLGLAVDGVSYLLADGREICPAVAPVVLPVATGLRGLNGCRGLINPAAVFADVLGVSDGVSGDMERRMAI